MAIPSDQAEEVKKQVMDLVDKSQMENKDQIKKYIQGLSEEELEEFLKQNKIQIASAGSAQEKQSLPQECVFCSIVKGEIPSYKLAETKKAVTILEINPLSKGHSIVLPIEHTSVEKIPKSSLTLAQKITKKIKKKLKPDDIKIETSSFMGHAMINIIPIYKDIPLKKIKADEKDLLKIQSKLETKKRSPRKKTEKSSKQKSFSSNLPIIKRRIP